MKAFGLYAILGFYMPYWDSICHIGILAGDGIWTQLLGSLGVEGATEVQIIFKTTGLLSTCFAFLCGPYEKFEVVVTRWLGSRDYQIGRAKRVQIARIGDMAVSISWRSAYWVSL